MVPAVKLSCDRLPNPMANFRAVSPFLFMILISGSCCRSREAVPLWPNFIDQNRAVFPNLSLLSILALLLRKEEAKSVLPIAPASISPVILLCFRSLIGKNNPSTFTPSSMQDRRSSSLDSMFGRFAFRILNAVASFDFLEKLNT